MKRSYKFRMRPTARQHVTLRQCLEDHRELYNAALQERRDAWKRERKTIRFFDQSADLPYIRSVRPDIRRWGAGSQQATLRRLDRTFQTFFKRRMAAEKIKYPRFKGQNRFDSVTWPRVGDACKWKPDRSRVYLLGIGNIKVTLHRPVNGRVKTITVHREGRHWYLILACEDIPNHPLEPVGADIGLDVGIASFATTSDGEKIANPRYGRRSGERLASAQRSLRRKQPGSSNRLRAKEVVSNRHRKERRQRRDFHFKVARYLVSTHDRIVLEDIKIENLVRRSRPRPDATNPGHFENNGGRAKTGLTRSIFDAGWGQFRQILADAAEDANRQIFYVAPHHTSRRCHQCGHTEKGNRVDRATFRCLRCGHTAHADVNAAKNILRAGLALLDAQASGEESAA